MESVIEDLLDRVEAGVLAGGIGSLVGLPIPNPTTSVAARTTPQPITSADLGSSTQDMMFARKHIFDPYRLQRLVGPSAIL